MMLAGLAWSTLMQGGPMHKSTEVAPVDCIAWRRKVHGAMCLAGC